ncbi:DUF4145 domain-containing protein [Cohnella sp. GCM10020058]|uniref:DUF4145 domain-containing protein n=1 Tax=Cohnella sp. GCM10020058 TaxID=3317330 RepID=UPI0036268144
MKNYCVKCHNETNHDILEKHVRNQRDEYLCDEYYYIVKCMGCENITFRYEFHDIDGGYPTDNDDGGWYVPTTVSTYPNVIKNHRPIQEMYYVPETLKELYQQSISAYKEGAKILAGLGFRGIIEAICNEQTISGDNLQERIGKLADNGIISRMNADLLHAIRFLGNDAAHEIKNPSDQQLSVALRIIEHMINSLYILEREAEGVFETVLANYGELEPILKTCIKSKVAGDELTLKEILGRHFRRLFQHLGTIESDLIDAITNGKQPLLTLGKTVTSAKKTLQYYVVV